MKKNLSVVLAFLLFFAFIWSVIYVLSHHTTLFRNNLPGTQIIKGANIANYESGLQWAPSPHAIPFSPTLSPFFSFAEHPFLKTYFPNTQQYDEAKHTGLFVNSNLSGLYSLPQRDIGGRMQTIIVFNNDGSYIKNIKLTSNTDNAQWVGQKLYLTGSNGKSRHILDPKDSPEYKAVSTDKDFSGSFFSLKLSDDTFLSQMCTNTAFYIGDGSPPCTETTISLLDTKNLRGKNLVTIPTLKGSVCMATDNKKLYIKTIPGPVLNKELKNFNRNNPEYDKVIDYCNPPDGLNFADTSEELTIIPLSSVH